MNDCLRWRLVRSIVAVLVVKWPFRRFYNEFC